jgi:hypothetical protein
VAVRGGAVVDVVASGATLFVRESERDPRADPFNASLAKDKGLSAARCRAALESALAAGYEGVRSAHARDHAALYNRTALEVERAGAPAPPACERLLTTRERVKRPAPAPPAARARRPCRSSALTLRAAAGSGGRACTPRRQGGAAAGGM